jgi:hypothetical protein
MTALVGSTVGFQPAMVPCSVTKSSLAGADLPPDEMTNPLVPLIVVPVGNELAVLVTDGIVTVNGVAEGSGWPVPS